MAENSSVRNVLTIYKKMLQMARGLSEPRRSGVIVEIKQQFRANKEKSTSEVAALLETANSSLGYLKIITPRVRAREGQSGTTRLVFGPSVADGKGGRKPMTNWTGANLDPDSVSKHNALLRRAGFQNNRDAKGIF